MTIDLASIGRSLKKSVENIETAVKLLDEGNTIPFITRFRKDQTGGLTEEQLATIKASVARLRALAERKTFVLKSIDSQGKLTDPLRQQIESANSNRELEYVYLPFKPKKQPLATAARQNGLEPLANDIFEGREPEKDLASRATDFVRVDKNLNSVDEVIAGVRHILAERFSDDTALRKDLRTIINSGRLTTKLIELESSAEDDSATATTTPAPKTAVETSAADSGASDSTAPDPNLSNSDTSPKPIDNAAEKETAAPKEPESTETASSNEPNSDSSTSDTNARNSDSLSNEPATVGNSETDAASAEQAQSPEAKSDSPKETETATLTTDSKPEPAKKKRKKKKKKKVDDPYKEFHDFAHPIEKMPYYKTLALNRGEKNGRVKVKIEYNEDEFLNQACQRLVPDEHPFKEFLIECVKDGMSRLVAPSLEREARREITEAAEKHAVEVFARNLKHLLLQSPVRDHRVLSIDPGYKRGCSVAVLDRAGNLLANAHVFVVGNEKRKTESKQTLVELIKTHDVSLIAIGNGAACREAEQMISDVLSESFPDGKLKYSIVNEAGASFYSTSEVGREEFPDLSPAVRSAVSIGRRLIDPLSELVKISPANIGVGLYQHDVKAKHLAESLDDVVQFCVNRVGVDVNTASTSLLRYVSGLNQLTARRVFEYREEHGPFKNREQLKQVSGFGEATFVQSAGFLRVHRGDQPLDTTSVHPEHYSIALKIIEKASAQIDELFPIAVSAAKVETAAQDASVCEATAADPQPDAESQSQASEETTPTPSTNEPATTPDPAGDVSESQQANEAQQANESQQDETTADPCDVQTNDAAVTAKPTGDTVEDADESSKSQPLAHTQPRTSSPESKSNSDVELTAAQSQRRREIVKQIRQLDADQLAADLGVGKLLIQDIVHSICRPEYDPRSNFNRPVFRSGIIKIDDLAKDMKLDAQVVNVVDFGVFVDIGLGTSCLVHVSQLAAHYIRDPHRFYAVGDSLQVWVTEVEKDKRRVKLTALQPASLRPPKKHERKSGKNFSKSGSAKSGQGRNSRRGQPNKPTSFKQKRKAKPKPVKPITKDMLSGAEPMRSFSDLAQFFTKQPDGKEGDKS